MIKEKILAVYKRNLFNRCDDNGSIFYFSEKDFKDLRSEEFEFLSSKKDVLKGKFYYYDNYKPNRLIIFDHGMGGGHLSYFREIELLAKNGFKVFSYDHTGCMQSEGVSTNGFAQSLSDLNDCISTIKQLEEYKDYSISVVGHSWGAFSTMNIVKYHDDIKSIVAMSGFISIDAILKQTFSGLLRGIYKEAYALEKKSNPDYIDSCAIDSLKNYHGNALIIHSMDDKVVKGKYHFNVLKEKLKDNKNISFLSTNNKNHNPNYTVDAVKYKDYFFKQYQKALKKKGLQSDEQKQKFIAKFDWYRMTTQDMNLWNHILNVLNEG